MRSAAGCVFSRLQRNPRTVPKLKLSIVQALQPLVVTVAVAVAAAAFVAGLGHLNLRDLVPEAAGSGSWV